MALTTEDKQSLLDALEKSIFEGVLRVEYGDKKVEYRSLNEMIRTRDLLKGELGLLTRPRRTYASFSKGLDPTIEPTNTGYESY